MKELNIEQVLEALKKSVLPVGTLLLQGDELFLERELKDGLRASGVELKEVELKKAGPDSSLEEASMGGSLFSSSQVLWLKKGGAPSQWTKAALDVWQRMHQRADGRSFAMLLQVPMDKRISYASLDLEARTVLDIEAAQKPKWIKFINDKRQAKLSPDKLRFLLENFDEPLLIYDQWIDLWNLGGDFWARAALGWAGPDEAGAVGVGNLKKKMIFSAKENPAYLWVDAVLRGQHKVALKLVDHLFDEGSEALQLLGLLSKSVRIMAHLESGQPLRGQADFMVQKIRAVLQSSSVKKGRGMSLLNRCVEADRKLKSSQTNARAILMRLSL